MEVWNAHLFGKLKQRDDSEFNVDGVTQAVHSKWFWSYLEMCSEVVSVLFKLSAWAEDCPCHSNFFKVKHLKSAKHRSMELARLFKKLIRSDVQGDLSAMWEYCPNRGKRAVELACGKIGDVINELFEQATSIVVVMCRGLSEEDVQSLLQGFSEARAMLVAVFTLKTHFWVTLPWKLAGLFHWHGDNATQCARECLSLFQRRPVDEEHHRISVEFLSVNGKWLAEVEKLARGESLLTLPIAFLKRCAELGLTPVVERLMEQRHAFVGQRLLIGPRKRRSPTTVSLGTGRMKEIECRLDIDPMFSEVLSKSVSLMRNPRTALANFGLTVHPRVAAQCRLLDQHVASVPQPPRVLPHNSYLWPGLSDIVYRLCGDDQYRSTAVVTKAIAKQQLETAQLKRKLNAAAAPRLQSTGSRTEHMRKLMRAHLVQECQRKGPGYMFSLRCSSATDSDFQIAIAALEDHVTTGIGQTVLRAPAVERRTENTVRDEAAQLDEIEAAFNDDSVVMEAGQPVDAIAVVDPAPSSVQDDYFKDI